MWCIGCLRQAKKAEIERTRRLEDARRELAGPLLVAAQALRERISDILQPNGFFETNFKDKTEAAVMSTMFIMCKCAPPPPPPPAPSPLLQVSIHHTQPA